MPKCIHKSAMGIPWNINGSYLQTSVPLLVRYGMVSPQVAPGPNIGAPVSGSALVLARSPSLTVSRDTACTVKHLNETGQPWHEKQRGRIENKAHAVSIITLMLAKKERRTAHLRRVFAGKVGDSSRPSHYAKYVCQEKAPTGTNV